MMRLQQLANYGHFYECRDGRTEPDLSPFLDIFAIRRTIDLPGFCERQNPDGSGGVTYESHHFWIHFLTYKRERDPDRMPTHWHDALVIVRHGAGWEIWAARGLLADALARYGEDTRGLFKLCWALMDAGRENREQGAREASEKYQRAFVEGRLKKRKLPSRGAVKVWIEPPASEIRAAS